MCDRCNKMEGAFFTEYTRNGHFSAALAAAMAAGLQYDQENPDSESTDNMPGAPEGMPEDVEPNMAFFADAAAHALGSDGYHEGLKQYAEKNGVELRQQLDQAMEAVYVAIGAAREISERFGGQPIPTMLDVTAHQTAAFGQMGVTGFPKAIVLASALMTEMVTNEEVYKALTASRTNLDGFNL